jgi:O-antigen/teichoic acid export membrane protein
MAQEPNNAIPAMLRKHAGKIYQMLVSISEEAFELGVSLAIMIMVERIYGQQGLGIYAYLAACLYTVRTVINFGVARHTERQTAQLSHPGQQQRMIGHSAQAMVITGLAGAAALLATAGFDTSHTRVQERLAAYVIIALILPLANLNSLKLAILHGRGLHQRVAQIRMLRHGIILGGTFLCCGIGVAPSYLLIAVLIADGVTAANLRRHLRLPPLRSTFRQMRKVFVTLRQGRAYLFTDNALDMLLNIDLFVLGLFVDAWNLGVYAEAAVLVRFFLIIPAGIRPILRRQYILATGSQDQATLRALLQRHAAILFIVHASAALIVVLNFPALLDLFFQTRGETRQAFTIFLVFLPGLIFFGPLTAQEPVYEAAKRVLGLRRLTLGVSAANLVLTFCLVPAAGVMGAAMATMLTMLIYFLLFGRNLSITPWADRFTYLVAGLGLYLIYTLLSWLSWSSAVTIWLGPVMAGLLFYVCGVFEPASPPARNRAYPPMDEDKNQTGIPIGRIP